MGTHQIQLAPVLPDPGGDQVEKPTALHQVAPEDPLPTPLAAQVSPAATRGFLVPLLSSIIVLLVFCLGWLLWSSLHSGSRTVQAATHELPLFWRTFLDNGKPTRIVLPTPVFFAWGPPANRHVLMARDVSVNEFNKLDQSVEISALEKKLGKPGPWRNYTVASDTFASLRLARFFDSYGVQNSISSGLSQ